MAVSREERDANRCWTLHFEFPDFVFRLPDHERDAVVSGKTLLAAGGRKAIRVYSQLGSVRVEYWMELGSVWHTGKGTITGTIANRLPVDAKTLGREIEAQTVGGRVELPRRNHVVRGPRR